MTQNPTQASTLPKFMYGTAWKKDETARLVALAVDTGFSAIDTANQPKHYNEPALGDALLTLADQGFSRDRFFIQTKFTPLDGQDHRVPYDTSASLTDQVQQSFDSSLNHLHTDYIDSYLLHGPYTYDGLGNSDWEVWRAIESLKNSGKVHHIGISNVTLRQIEELWANAAVKPTFVQNRCYTSRGWDLEVRRFCTQKNIVYQGFSLLTANVETLRHQTLQDCARKHQATPAQIVFRFAQQVGMMPLTGTTNVDHMRSDLACDRVNLSANELRSIEEIHL